MSITLVHQREAINLGQPAHIAYFISLGQPAV